MAKHDLIERIRRFNSARDPQRLAFKYRAMRGDAFGFLRGTCHLFYQDLPRHEILSNAPATWVCGDLHLQNFGSYRGDNRLTYFDLNDFDEAVLAPCTWELVRLLASALVGAKAIKVNEPEAFALCEVFLDSYRSAIAQGKARWVERATASGMVKDLLRTLKQRVRSEFLDQRTELVRGGRKIMLDGRRALPVSKQQRKTVTRFMREFAEQQSEQRFFELLDVARRIAGTGSLGIERYVLLIEGKGSPHFNHLLDLKHALPSCLAPCLKLKQPHWSSEAERVVAIQSRMQAISPAFLHAVQLGGVPFVLKELQPTADRVNLAHWDGRLRRLENVLATMGELVAWAQLRSSGRQGSAMADELIGFAADERWRKALLELARACAERTIRQWREFGAAFDAGAFDLGS